MVRRILEASIKYTLFNLPSTVAGFVLFENVSRKTGSDGGRDMNINFSKYACYCRGYKGLLLVDD